MTRLYELWRDGKWVGTIPLTDERAADLLSNLEYLVWEDIRPHDWKIEDLSEAMKCQDKQ